MVIHHTHTLTNNPFFLLNSKSEIVPAYGWTHLRNQYFSDLDFSEMTPLAVPALNTPEIFRDLLEDPYFLWISHWSQQGLISWSISEIEESTYVYLKSCSTTSHRTKRMQKIHVLLKNLSGVHLSMVRGCNLRKAWKRQPKSKRYERACLKFPMTRCPGNKQVR